MTKMPCDRLPHQDHLGCTLVGVVTIRSSVNPLVVDFLQQSLARLPFLLVTGIIRFTLMAKRIGEMVHPVTIPFWTGLNLVVNLDDWKCSLIYW